MGSWLVRVCGVSQWSQLSGGIAVFWGTGIVFFLAKFINLHNDITQGFWVELCQQVETGAQRGDSEVPCVFKRFSRSLHRDKYRIYSI